LSQVSQEFQTTKSESHVSLEVKMVDPPVDRAKALRQPDVAYGTVVENRVLTRLHTHGEKRHIGKIGDSSSDLELITEKKIGYRVRASGGDELQLWRLSLRYPA
jgi:hypothetical protein